MAISTGRLIDKLKNLFPEARSEPGDRVGLQIEPDFEDIERVLIALDPGREVLDEAREIGAQMVLTHHPLFFKPLEKIKRFDLSRDFICSGIGLYVAHTNFDRDFLAPSWGDVFGLRNQKPIACGNGEPLFKLVVFVPEGYLEKVRNAIFSRGAGHIGNYDQTSFQIDGKGTFRPRKGANPFIGESGKLEETREIRLETIVSGRFLSGVIEEMKTSHPYEEVAYDLFHLANEPDSGLGIIGDLPRPLKTGEIEKLMGQNGLGVNLRWGDVGDRFRSKMAIVPGKGGKILPEAISAGADIFVSGDIDYHQFQMGKSKDVLIIDPGHFYLEIRGKKVMETLLKESLPEIETILSSRESCPYYHQE